MSMVAAEIDSFCNVFSDMNKQWANSKSRRIPVENMRETLGKWETLGEMGNVGGKGKDCWIVGKTIFGEILYLDSNRRSLYTLERLTTN